MQNYLLHLKYEGTIELPDDSPECAGILKQRVIDAIATQSVALLDYEKWDNREIDHHDDGHDALTETATYIDINLPVADPEQIDWHDGGESLYNYMAEALELGEVELAYNYHRDQGELIKTVIGFNIVE